MANKTKIGKNNKILNKYDKYSVLSLNIQHKLITMKVIQTIVIKELIKTLAGNAQLNNKKSFRSQSINKINIGIY